MFSNRQQDNSSNLLRQKISTSGSIGSPSIPLSDSVAIIATNNNYNLSVTPVTTTNCVSNNSSGSNSMLSAKNPDGEDNNSAANNVTDHDTMLRKVTKKRCKKNILKIRIKYESKNSGCQTINKNNKIMSEKNKYLKQTKKEQSRLAAARFRKRRMDHMNKLEEEIKELEREKSSLQSKIPALHYQVTDLQNKLAQHKCIMKNGLEFN